MLVAFQLTMPNVGSWDGKWSGSDSLYARVRKARSKTDIEAARRAVAGKPFHYSWTAGKPAEEAASRAREQLEALLAKANKEG